MLQARVMPCLLVDDRRLVKTIKFKNPSYIGDPVNAIKIYNEKEVDELILLDITATINNKRPDLNLIQEVASECFMPLAYGGGISTIDDIKNIFKLGVEKIALNTGAVENPKLVKEAVDIYGSQSIIIAIDVKKSVFNNYHITTHGGRKQKKISPEDWAREMEGVGAGEILLNSVDRDGTWSGFDLGIIKKVVDAVTIPVIACGGAGSVNDLREAIKIGNASAVAAGSMMVYQGKDLGVLINFPARSEIKDFVEG